MKKREFIGNLAGIPIVLIDISEVRIDSPKPDCALEVTIPKDKKNKDVYYFMGFKKGTKKIKGV